MPARPDLPRCRDWRRCGRSDSALPSSPRKRGLITIRRCGLSTLRNACDRSSHGMTDSLFKQPNDFKRKSAISRRDAPEVCKKFPYPPIRGRREYRVHAAPAVSCAKVHKRNAHEHTGSAEAIRHSLRNGFTAYFALSPAIGLSCHRRWRCLNRQLDAGVEASGPHDFAVRLKRCSSKAPSASTASRPAFVTTAKRPSSGTGQRWI